MGGGGGLRIHNKGFLPPFTRLRRLHMNSPPPLGTPLSDVIFIPKWGFQGDFRLGRVSVICGGELRMVRDDSQVVSVAYCVHITASPRHTVRTLLSLQHILRTLLPL